MPKSRSLNRALTALVLGTAAVHACRDFSVPNEDAAAGAGGVAGIAGVAGRAGATEVAGASLGGDRAFAGASGEPGGASGAAGAGNAGVADALGGSGDAGMGGLFSAPPADGAGQDGEGGAPGTPPPRAGAESGGRAPTPGEDQVITPQCRAGEIALPVAPSRDVVAIDRGDFMGALALYATRPLGHLASLKWQQLGSNEVGPLDRGWGPWECFDTVPNIERITYGFGAETVRHLFASTTSGSLYMRFSGPSIPWTPWQQLSMPYPGEPLTDLAATSMPAPTSLYVVSGGEVLVRSRQGTLASSAMGPWHSLGNLEAREIAAAVAADGVHTIVAVNNEGALWKATGTPDELDGLRAWVTVPAPTEFTAVDLATQIPPRGDSPAQLLALDAAGALWGCAVVEECEWQLMKPGETAPVLRAIAGTIHGARLVAVGVDDTGVVRLATAPWIAWVPLD